MACLLFFDVLFAVVLVSFVPEGFVVCQAGRVIAAINCSNLLLATKITSYLFMRVTVTRTSAVFF